jgi:hypothetical protein
MNRTYKERYNCAMPSVSRLRRRVSFARVIEGDVDPAKRRHCERALMEHLIASGITLEAVVINDDGCSFIIDGRDEARFAKSIGELNVAVKFHEHCARIALTRSATDWPLPSLSSVMEAFDDEGVDVVNLTSDAATLTVLVEEPLADRVVQILSRFYQPSGARTPGRVAS